LKPYAARAVFSTEAVNLWNRASRMVDRLPKHMDRHGREIRCHELARALGRILELPVVDGATVGCDHSWLVVDRTTFLDPYRPGCLPMVQLIDTGLPTLTRLTYDQARRVRDDIRLDVVEDLVRTMRNVEAFDKLYTDPDPAVEAADIVNSMYAGEYGGEGSNG
jgi:hypothetical protein